jgi:hypothetical protein
LKRITLLLITLLAMVLAACASEQAASPSASDSATSATETPEPASEEPAASDDPLGSADAIPSFDLNGDPELAARFPDTVGGEPLQVQSMRGDTFASFGGQDPAFDAFLEAVDAELSDVSVAFGGAASADASSFLSVGAFRVLGASQDDLEREFLASFEGESELTGAERTTIGGKDVWTAVDPSGETDASVVIYTKDDTVYFLTGTDDQLAEILEALP